nr:cell wall-binding repeat-containing protein [Chloroflexota bacterium]
VSESVAVQVSTHAPTYRLAGANRYATAVAVSSGWPAGVPNVFIATGANFPDALAGVPASGALGGGPLLLTAQNSLPPETAAELMRLDPARVVILGSSGVISDAVASQVSAAAGAPVLRVAGANRFATAATVSAFAFPAAETTFVANGLDFPDALAGGPSGGAFGGPLLLSTATSAQPPTMQELQRLQPARIFILGGPSVVSDGVINQFDALFP